MLAFVTNLQYFLEHVMMYEIKTAVSRVLYRFTNPIRYVSSMFSINVWHVSTIFSVLSSNMPMQPTEICDVEQ